MTWFHSANLTGWRTLDRYRVNFRYFIMTLSRLIANQRVFLCCSSACCQMQSRGCLQPSACLRVLLQGKLQGKVWRRYDMLQIQLKTKSCFLHLKIPTKKRNNRNTTYRMWKKPSRITTTKSLIFMELKPLIMDVYIVSCCYRVWTWRWWAACIWPWCCSPYWKRQTCGM